jgi:mannitol-1-phosphate 5-dehydrogenase
MQAVQFGAGKIGRGFLGQLLFEGGYWTTFVDADTALVDALNGRCEYPLWLVSERETQTQRIGNLCALEARRDREKVTQAIVEADLISIAVGANVLPHIALALAAGLNARAVAGCGPIDVLLCENQWHAADLVRGLLTPYIAPEARTYFETQVGLVETVIGRMVPVLTDVQRAEDPLLIVAEPYQELPIARAALRGEVPSLPGLIAADDFEAYEARKLYLHNMSHAALAYVGYLRGHEYVWQCAADPQVVEVCREALDEVVPALAAEHGFLLADLTAFAEDLLGRFANKALGDTVGRVAADPLRKLRPEDRLVGAAHFCLKQGRDTGALAQVIASAFAYDAPSDASAQKLQAQRRLLGDATVLETVCGIEPGSWLAIQVSEALRSLPRKTI